MKKYIIALSFIGILGTAVTSCSNEFLDTDFGNSVQATTLNSVEELESFVIGAYGSMRNVNYYGAYYQLFAEVRSDEMFSRRSSGYFGSVANMSMTSTDSYATGPYGAMYTVVAKANIVINTPDNVTWSQSNNSSIIAEKVNQVKGQAYAIRALAFFDLLKLYGQQYSGGTTGVVIPTTYNPNANLPRATVAQTEAQIEADFNKAIQLLSGNAFESTGQKVILNEYSVKALMSRYYLYKKDYAKVRQLTEDIIGSGLYSVSPRDLFKVSYSLNNAAVNSMFELSVGTTNAFGASGLNAMMTIDTERDGTYKNVCVLSGTNNAYTAADVRKSFTTITNTSTILMQNFKYPDKGGSDNIKMIRYEEVLLNAAEAQLPVNGGSQTLADKYYNLIGANRITGYTNLTNVTLAQVKAERRRELLGEGFRMWDLLRWGDPVPVATSTGSTTGTAVTLLIGDKRLAFPIPQSETNVSGTLVTSNPGYDN